MKTTNLTPWCNLFSSASKYNICVKKSRYKTLLYTGSTVTSIVLLLVFFTYSYHFALALAVITFILLGVMLTKQTAQPVIVLMFELNSQGLCTFDGNVSFQLQANSRFSFLGCWLTLQPLTAQPVTSGNSIFNTYSNEQKKMLFIYRDSLSGLDFSRLSNVISQLNH